MESVGWNHDQSSQFKIEILQHPQSFCLNASKVEITTPMLSLTQSTPNYDNENEGSVSSSGDSFNLPDTSFRCFCIASLVSTESEKGKGKARAASFVDQSLSKAVGGQENLPLSLKGDTISSLYHFVKRSCFVFPDLKILVLGDYRLEFSLYEILKEGTHFVTSILSDEFTVSQPKATTVQADISSSFPSRALRDHIRQGSRISSSPETRMTPPFAPLIAPPPFQTQNTYPLQSSSSNSNFNTSKISRKRSMIDLGDQKPPIRHNFRRSTSDSTEISSSTSRYLHPGYFQNSSHNYGDSSDMNQPNYRYPIQPFVGTTSISPLMQAHQPYSAYPFLSSSIGVDPINSHYGVSNVPSPSFLLGPPFLPLPPPLLPRPPALPESISLPIPTLHYSQPFLNDPNRIQPQSYPISAPNRNEYQLGGVEKLSQGTEGQIAGSFGKGVTVEQTLKASGILENSESARKKSEQESSGKGDLKFLLGENLNIESREEELGGFFCE